MDDKNLNEKTDENDHINDFVHNSNADDVHTSSCKIGNISDPINNTNVGDNNTNEGKSNLADYVNGTNIHVDHANTDSKIVINTEGTSANKNEHSVDKTCIKNNDDAELQCKTYSQKVKVQYM